MGSLLSRLVLGAGVAAALIASAPESAGAQPAPKAAPSAADKQAAAKLVDAGIAAQDAKDYDKAIELYKRAYALVPHPTLMFNIGQAHRLAGRPAQAATFYKRYLELDPKGGESAAAHAALAAIHAGTAAGSTSQAISGQPSGPAKATGPAEVTQPGATRPDEPGKSGETPRTLAPVSPDSEPTTVGSTPAPMPALAPDAPLQTDTVASPGRTLRITGIVLGGAGLASAAVGVYFTTRVLHWEAEADKEGSPYTVSKPRGEAAQLRGDIAYGIAGALAIGGAVTYWLGHSKDQSARTTALAPVVGAGFAGISLTGSLP
jgi:hypothetical protein